MDGRIPNLDAAGFGRLDGLPVNFAARAVLDIALAEDRGDGIVEGEGLSVAHVVNCWPDGKTWKNTQEWLSKPSLMGRERMQIIEADEWTERFKELGRERGKPMSEERDDDGLAPRGFSEIF